MTRGAERRRRAGLRRLISRRRKVSQSRSGAMSSGGKGALVGHGLAADPERGDEADAVRVVAGMRGAAGHQGADRGVAEHVSRELLKPQLAGLRRPHGTLSSLMALE